MALIWKKGLTLLTFFALSFLKKIQIYQAWFLFGVIPGVDSYSCHFGTINNKMVSKLEVGMSTTDMYLH